MNERFRPDAEGQQSRIPESGGKANRPKGSFAWRGPDDPFADDILRGAAAIANYLFGDASLRRKVYHLKRSSRMPFFYIGSRLCLRKSRFHAWVGEQEDRSAGGRNASATPWLENFRKRNDAEGGTSADGSGDRDPD